MFALQEQIKYLWNFVFFVEPRHRRHSSPVHRNAGKRGGHMSSVMYPSTTAAVDQGSDSLEDDVYMSMVAYSVGTLDQRAGESSHLCENRQRSPTTTQSTFAQQSFLENTTNHLNDSNIPNNQEFGNIDHIMSSSKLRICLCPPDAELPEFDRNEFT